LFFAVVGQLRQVGDEEKNKVTREEKGEREKERRVGCVGSSFFFFFLNVRVNEQIKKRLVGLSLSWGKNR